MVEGLVQQKIKGALTILFSLEKRSAINLIIICVIFFFEILVISSQGWQANSNTNYGLWKTCLKYRNTTCCANLDISDGCLNTTRAFLIMSILSTCATLIVMGRIAQKIHNGSFSDLGLCLILPLFCTVLCLFIAVMVYGICNNNEIDDASLSWSFVICVIAMIMSFFHMVSCQWR